MPRESIRALKCFVGAQPYCLDAGDVLAIDRGRRMLPNSSPEGPRGWIIWRGARIPVFGLAELLYRTPRTSQTSVVLIVDREHPFGIAVDRVARMEMAGAALQPLPDAARGPRTACFRGVIAQAGVLILFLVPERLRAEAAGSVTGPEQAPPPVAPHTTAPARPASGGRLLMFSPPNAAGGELSSRILLGLSYTQTLEIITGVQCTPVPGAPCHVLGVVPWHARPLAIIDAGMLLGLEPGTASAAGRLVVVRSPRWRAAIALPVGGGVHARTLPFPHGPCPPDLMLDLTHARGAFALEEGRVLVLPDLDTIAAPAPISN